ncbi:MAG: hypothetical protein GY810_09030 [Aureispira sp.]|nr:hypothetical protein [Aureispira sp.]
MKNWLKQFSLTLLLVITSCSIYAQQGIRMDYDELPLEEVLADIGTLYRINFSYSNDQLPLKKKVTIHIKGKTLKESLDILFKLHNIEYAYIGNQVVLKRKRWAIFSKKDKSIKEISKAERLRKKKERAERRAKRKTLLEKDIYTEIMKPKEEEPPKVKLSTNVIAPIVLNKLELVDDAIASSIQIHRAEVDEVPVPHQKVINATANTQFMQLSIAPFLSTTLGNTSYNNVLSFNIIWGINRGITGLEIGGIANSLKGRMHGVQVAGIFNNVYEDANGLQVAGFYNMVGGDVYGWQTSGLWNIGGDVHGVQLTGLANISKSLYGLQVACFANMAQNVFGVQISPLFNFANGHLYGVQFGGFGNLAWGGRNAIQFGGLFNYADGAQFQASGGVNVASKVEGGQIGLFNKANHVKGFQLGFINVVDSIDGVPIGLINIVKHGGYNRMEIFASETMHLGLGAKFGGRYFYQTLQVATKLNGLCWGLGYGIGSAFPFGQKWNMNIEFTTMHINENELWTPKLNLLNQFRWTAEYILGQNGKTSVFFGPTFNVMVSRRFDIENQVYGSQIMPYQFLDKTGKGTNVKLWVGAYMGVRF